MRFPFDSENNLFLLQSNSFEFNSEEYEKNFQSCRIQMLKYFYNNNQDQNSEEEDKELENKILYIEGKTSDTVKNKNIGENMKLTQKKRNRGRKRKKNDIKNNEIHDKNSDDNLQRKIQVHYLCFIVSFLNVVLKELGYNYEFLNLENKFKIKVSNNSVKELNKKNLGEIICNKISKNIKIIMKITIKKYMRN